MTWIASAISFLGPVGTAITGSAILGAVGANKQAKAATQASQTQYQATQDAAKQQREMFDILNAQQAPYREAGTGALTDIKSMLPYFTKQITAEDLRSMPGFEFGLNQGTGAAGQAMNVGGGGSNVNMARTKFATDYATNVGLPMYMKQRESIFNTLADIAKIGQGATGQTSTLGSNTANALSQLGIGGASALGAGQIGAANAYSGAFGGLGNNLMLSQFLTPQGGTGITPGGATTMSPELANSLFGTFKT
jgi:hypothetical protein